MKQKQYWLPVKLMSYSAMSLFQGCPRRYAFRYIDKIPADWQGTGAMDRGTAFHALVEHDGAMPEGLPELNPFDTAKVKSGFRKYKEYQAAGHLPEMEVGELKLVDEERQFIGYVDRHAILKNGAWRLGEMKTSERFDPMQWQLYPVNPQIALYAEMAQKWANANLLSNDDFLGFSVQKVIFSAKRPGKARKSKAAESPEAFAERIREDTRIFVQNVTPSEVVRAEALLTFEHVKESVDHLGSSSSRYPKNIGNCMNFGRICEFAAHCHGAAFSEGQESLLDVDMTDTEGLE